MIGDDFFYQQKRGLMERNFDRWLRDGRRFGYDKKPAWLARITGVTAGGLRREFVKGVKDYTDANGVGSRGVWQHFALDNGVYEVHERLTWGKTHRYFMRVCDGVITEIKREEVEQWL